MPFRLRDVVKPAADVVGDFASRVIWMLRPPPTSSSASLTLAGSVHCLFGTSTLRFELHARYG